MATGMTMYRIEVLLPIRSVSAFARGYKPSSNIFNDNSEPAEPVGHSGQVPDQYLAKLTIPGFCNYKVRH